MMLGPALPMGRIGADGLRLHAQHHAETLVSNVAAKLFAVWSVSGRPHVGWRVVHRDIEDGQPRDVLRHSAPRILLAESALRNFASNRKNAAPDERLPA